MDKTDLRDIHKNCADYKREEGDNYTCSCLESPVDNSFGAIVTLARQITGWRGGINGVTNGYDFDIQIVCAAGQVLSLSDIPGNATNVKHEIISLTAPIGYSNHNMSYTNTNGAKVKVISSYVRD